MRERLPGYFRYLSSSFSRSFIVLAFLAPRRRNSSDREEEEALNNNNNNNREVNHYLTPITPNKNGRAQVAFIGRILKWRAQEIRGVDDKTRLSTFEIKRRRKRSSNCVCRLCRRALSEWVRWGLPCGGPIGFLDQDIERRVSGSFLVCVYMYTTGTHTHTLQSNHLEYSRVLVFDG
jgi:hypothetical protein